MGQRIVVIGAGIIGAAIACRLAEAGHSVRIIDSANPATGASGRSFGWINASFFANEAHFRLRAAGIAAWHRLGIDGVTWSGCLWFEEDGDALVQMHENLKSLNYPVEHIDKEIFHQLEPAIHAPPEHALRFPVEGAGETADLTHSLVRRAMAAGAIGLFGVQIQAIETTQGAVSCVITDAGTFSADHVIVAAGTATPDLIAPLGVTLPMLRRPGLLVTTRRLKPLLSHVLAAPDQELRQLPDGRLLAPTSPNHQADDAEDIPENVEELADAALGRVRALLPGHQIERDSITVALRPVPGDGLPVVGPAGPDGLYIATMHSGVTLAAITGELVTQELTNGGASELLEPFRPDRLQG